MTTGQGAATSAARQLAIVTATANKSSGTVTAEVNGVVTTIQAPRDLTIATGDVLLVGRVGSQWFAIQRYYTAAPATIENPTPPPPKPTVRTGTLVVAPVYTGTYRAGTGGWRTDTHDVYQGEFGSAWGLNTGAAFYGTKPRSLTGATVTSATVRLRRKNAGGVTAAQDTTFWLVTQSTKPAGAPTRTSSTDGPNLRWGQQTTFTIPDAWAQEMVDGTAGGLAVYEADGSPYVILDGKGSWSPAFTLTINWTRSS